MSSAADSDSHLQSLVLRLGNFHTQMSFLRCIGHLMGVLGYRRLLNLCRECCGAYLEWQGVLASCAGTSSRGCGSLGDSDIRSLRPALDPRSSSG